MSLYTIESTNERTKYRFLDQSIRGKGTESAAAGHRFLVQSACCPEKPWISFVRGGSRHFGTQTRRRSLAANSTWVPDPTSWVRKVVKLLPSRGVRSIPLVSPRTAAPRGNFFPNFRGFWLEIVADVIDTSRALRSTNGAVHDSRIFFMGHYIRCEKILYRAAAAVLLFSRKDDRANDDEDDDDDEEKPLKGVTIIVKGVTMDAIAISCLFS